MLNTALLWGLGIGSVVTILSLAFIPGARATILDNVLFNWIRKLNKSSGD